MALFITDGEDGFINLDMVSRVRVYRDDNGSSLTLTLVRDGAADTYLEGERARKFMEQFTGDPEFRVES